MVTELIISQKIIFFREQAKLSQKELAENANISREAIGNYENGRRIPSVDIAQRIADALGISVNDLLYPEPEKLNLNMEAIVNCNCPHCGKLIVKVKEEGIIKGGIGYCKSCRKEVEINYIPKNKSL